MNDLMLTNVTMVRLYQGLSMATIKRDMKALIERKLVVEYKGLYKGNIELLLSRLPQTKSQ